MFKLRFDWYIRMKKSIGNFKGKNFYFFPGAGVFPIMAYTGTFRLNGVLFSSFRYIKYKRVQISQVEVYKRVGKSVVSQRELNE